MIWQALDALDAVSSATNLGLVAAQLLFCFLFIFISVANNSLIVL